MSSIRFNNGPALGRPVLQTASDAKTHMALRLEPSPVPYVGIQPRGAQPATTSRGRANRCSADRHAISDHQSSTHMEHRRDINTLRASYSGPISRLSDHSSSFGGLYSGESSGLPPHTGHPGGLRNPESHQISLSYILLFSPNTPDFRGQKGSRDTVSAPEKRRELVCPGGAPRRERKILFTSDALCRSARLTG